MLKLFLPILPVNEQLGIINLKLDRILNSDIPVRRVILIGSAARLGMKEFSDVDLVVIYPDGEDEKNIRKSLAKNRGSDGWPEDLIVTSESYFSERSKIGGIYHVAANGGVEIYPNFCLEVTRCSP